MRGKGQLDGVCNSTLRITPAYAGKSKVLPLSDHIQKDHPRLCGEKAWQSSKINGIKGSPPPMRGKAECPDRLPDPERITPAYAGKSTIHKRPEIITKDHPRLCGEKCSGSLTLSFTPGSPPPMRGKDLEKRVAFANYGITPAYAGKRVSIYAAELSSQDHPRLCGEKLSTITSLSCI